MKQKQALDILKSGYNVFLTGAPGSGKTFLLNKYVGYLKKEGVNVSITASTGIAATHMGGTTLHSWSGLGIREELDEHEIKLISEKGYLRRKIKNTDVLIIDEISMIKPSQFDAVNKICQYAKRNSRPFGGIQVVCSGDFFQLPPVEKDASARASGKGTKFVVESTAWENMGMKVCYLDEQFRTKDKKLTKILNYIRENKAKESKKMLLESMDNPTSPRLRGVRLALTKLYTHNVDVDSINSAELAKIKGKEFYYQMTSRGHELVIENLKRSCLAPQRLVLKKGAEVMFLKNNFEAGYVNGTQGKIVDFVASDLPVVKTYDGKRITVKYADWVIEDGEKIVAGISQMPLRLAWAITVHKSQGMNLDTAEIDLSRCFLEGMGYVALSRLKTLKGLKLMGINDLAFSVNPKALELDKNFRKLSQKTVAELKKTPSAFARKRQGMFLKYLSI